MPYELKERSYPLREDEGVDDVCNKLVELSGSPYPIETVLITKTAIKVSAWEPKDEEPPYGGFKFDSPSSISSLLQSVDLHEVPAGETGLNAAALCVVAKMMLEARAGELAGVAWVVSDPPLFCRWIGVKKQPVRFLDLPLLQAEELPRHRLVLLCAKSSRNHPMTASRGVIASMEIKEEENAEV